jgi:hypothetical protein
MMPKCGFEYCGRPSLLDRVCSGSTPLNYSAESGKVDAFDILLKNGADVNATNDK